MFSSSRSRVGSVPVSRPFNYTQLTQMARRYDSRTTIFSPEGNQSNWSRGRGVTVSLVSTSPDASLPFHVKGRLYQVEYAMEAISHAGTALGVLATDGVVLAAEKKVTSKLLEQNIGAEKIYVLNRLEPSPARLQTRLDNYSTCLF